MSRRHWIQTHSGVAFDLLDPQPDMVRLRDIAHALSHLCRYTGHSRYFYSVAEHSVECARRAPPALVAEALMHDATEAYVGDVASPLKALLPEYRAIESRVRGAIAARFGLSPAVPAKVVEIDVGMLHIERAQLLGKEAQPWGLPPIEVAHSELACYTSSHARFLFLEYARLLNL